MLKDSSAVQLVPSYESVVLNCADGEVAPPKNKPAVRVPAAAFAYASVGLLVAFVQLDPSYSPAAIY